MALPRLFSEFGLFPLDPGEAGQHGHLDGVIADGRRCSNAHMPHGGINPDMQVLDVLPNDLDREPGDLDLRDSVSIHRVLSRDPGLPGTPLRIRGYLPAHAGSSAPSYGFHANRPVRLS